MSAVYIRNGSESVRKLTLSSNFLGEEHRQLLMGLHDHCLTGKPFFYRNQGGSSTVNSLFCCERNKSHAFERHTAGAICALSGSSLANENRRDEIRSDR
jgi:hypothetical protein